MTEANGEQLYGDPSTSTSTTTTSTSTTSTSTTSTSLSTTTRRPSMSLTPVLSGRSISTQDSHVWLRRHFGLDTFVWGGRCMRLDDITIPEGDLSITTRQNPRGGVERDAVRQGVPDLADTTLVMKQIQRDRMKSTLRRCFYDIDKRTHCGGIDRDAWNKWDEITRLCQANITERSDTGTTWEEGEDAMIEMSVSALDAFDIYRVSGDDAAAIDGKNIQILDVDVCMPSRCPSHCDDQEECVLAAVTEDDTTNSYLLTNRYGGEFEQWNSVALTDFGVQDADAVVCVGYLVIAVSNGASAIVVSDDLGTTLVTIDDSVVSEWTLNSPRCVDALDQTFVVMGGDNGYIYASYDAGRTWEVLDAGQATSDALDEIAICPTDPQTIYAASGTADTIVKSVNGGQTWFAATATGMAGTGITALCVLDEAHVLVGTDAGEIFESTDGGESWVEQTDLPLTSKADADVNDIAACGCGVVWLVVSDSVTPEYFVFRNVDGGADGRWFVPDDMPSLADELLAAACCSANHLVGVGGTATTSSHVVLLE